MELVPLHWLLGHYKLRSEGRGGPILLVPEVISFQFPPLWKFPYTIGSVIASCHAYSLHCVAQDLAGEDPAASSSSSTMVCSQSPHPTSPLPDSLNRAQVPQMRPPLTPAWRLPAACHLATCPLQTAIRVKVSYVPGCFLQLATEAVSHHHHRCTVPHHLEQVFF